MIGNIDGMKSGFILLDKDGKFVYGSLKDKDRINTFLEETHAYDRINTENFGIEKWGNFQVMVDRVFINNQSLYIIEFMMDVQNGIFASMAYKDIMSGLYNRNMWEYVLHNNFEEVQTQFSTLIIVDIDNLKEVNDNEGHGVGDMQIKIVSESIKESIREGDLAFRYGGDEFIILLYDLKDKDIQQFTNRIREKIKEKSKEYIIDVSIGVSDCNEFSELTKAFQKADDLLYAEKQYKKLQVISKKYKELSALKRAIEETRKQLSVLIGEKEELLNDDIVDLSRKLDHVIYRYITLEIDLNS